jgi:hypothetical protein
MIFDGASDAGWMRIKPGGGDDFIHEWFSGYPFSYYYSMNFGEYKRYSVEPGDRTISTVSQTDTNNILFSGKFRFSSAINTLYLCGKYPNIDSVFRSEDNLPAYERYGNIDSSYHIRFANMSSNSGTVKIMFKDSVQAVGGLDYKQLTPFTKYSATAGSETYVFEVRDAATDEILNEITIDPNNFRFNTISVVLYGMRDENLSIKTVGYFD